MNVAVEYCLAGGSTTVGAYVKSHDRGILFSSQVSDAQFEVPHRVHLRLPELEVIANVAARDCVESQCNRVTALAAPA